MRFEDIPESIRRVVSGLDFTVDDVGCSEDGVLVFGDRFILKYSNDSARLKREAERIDWLHGKLPGAESVAFTEENGTSWYLRTSVNGDSLISERLLRDPDALTDALANAVAALRSLDGAGCPFRSSDSVGNDFVHGDLCLPNIYVNEKNELAGFIDVENSGLGDRKYDYSWMLWSLGYNLKTDKYDDMLMKKIGEEFDADAYDKYIPEDYR